MRINGLLAQNYGHILCRAPAQHLILEADVKILNSGHYARRRTWHDSRYNARLCDEPIYDTRGIYAWSGECATAGTRHAMNRGGGCQNVLCIGGAFNVIYECTGSGSDKLQIVEGLSKSDTLRYELDSAARAACAGHASHAGLEVMNVNELNEYT